MSSSRIGTTRPESVNAHHTPGLDTVRNINRPLLPRTRTRSPASNKNHVLPLTLPVATQPRSPLVRQHDKRLGGTTHVAFLPIHLQIAALQKPLPTGTSNRCCQVPDMGLAAVQGDDGEALIWRFGDDLQRPHLVTHILHVTPPRCNAR